MLHTVLYQLSSADPSLGRFDADSIPDQILMEMLIDGLRENQKSLFQDADGGFTDVCAWHGVECTGDDVKCVKFAFICFSEAQFPFERIPRRIEHFEISTCNLHGTLNTEYLPPNLTNLDLSYNRLHGSLNFKGLPSALVSLILRENDFHGFCALSDLPKTLVSFDAALNNFSGEIALDDLPAVMQSLNLQKNKLTGSVTIGKLPPPMVVLDLSKNSLSGDLALLLEEIPREMEYIDVTDNPLSGTIVLSEAFDVLNFPICYDGIEKVVDAHGNRHKLEKPLCTGYYD